MHSQSHNKLLILASTSRYRKTLLERLGLPFQTWSPDVDETALEKEPAPDLVKRLARLKGACGADDGGDRAHRVRLIARLQGTAANIEGTAGELAGPTQDWLARFVDDYGALDAAQDPNAVLAIELEDEA